MIERVDIKKFSSLSLMMSLLLFINHLLWDVKNTLIVYAAGAEALSLIKLIGTIPLAFLFMLLYSQMSRRLSREQLFYSCMLPFLLFFALFAFVIYPQREALHPSEEWINSMSTLYPRASTLVHLLGHWSYALFYVASELWSSVALSLLFWQLANDSVSMPEAKRFYPLFGFVANIAIMLAGAIIFFLSEYRKQATDPWEFTLQSLISVILVSGILALLLYRKIAPRSTYETEKKPTLTLKESFHHLRHSKELVLLAIMVIGFGVAQKIMEGLWQDQARSCHSDQNSYSAFIGKLSLFSGFATFCFMFIGNILLSYFRSSKTPFLIFAGSLLLMSASFFFMIIFPEGGMWPLLAVCLGSFQDVLSKTTKYTFCDPVKEMTYIGLDVEAKVKGKAAVDVVGERIGKHGGALVQQFFLFITASTLSSTAPYLAIICLAGLTVWLLATARLNNYSIKTAKNIYNYQ